MNRYYRPSAPRYTSQFVEEQLPTDLMFQAGQMKLAQQEQFAKNAAEMSALTANLYPGYRTVKMAPVVQQEWDQKINNWVSKYSTNYDDPGALQELYALKAQWAKDPNVNLIKLDREVGNKEWDELRKSPTFDQDIKKDIDPKTGMLWQFNKGDPQKGFDSYQPYQGLVRYQDWQDRGIKNYETIEPQTRSGYNEQAYTNAYGQPSLLKIQTDQKIRDPRMLREKTVSMANDVMNKTTPEGSYLHEFLKSKLGRIPTMEDAMNAYLPFEQSAAVSNVNSNYSSNVVDFGEDTNGSDNGIIGSGIKEHLGAKPQYAGSQVINSKNVFGRLRNEQVFNKIRGKEDIKIEDQPFEVQNVYNHLMRTDKTFAAEPNMRKRIKQMSEYVDQRNTEKYPKTTNLLKWDDQKELTATIIGTAIDGNEIKVNNPAQFLQGATLYDLETGVTNQEVKRYKADFIKKGNYFNISGMFDANDIPKLPNPNMLSAKWKAGDKEGNVAISVDFTDPKKDMQNRVLWNFGSIERDPATQTGDIFEIKLGSDGIPFIRDSSNTSDKKYISSTGGVFAIPYIDGKDGRYKVNLYRDNPFRDNKAEFGTDKGIYDKSNPYYLETIESEFNPEMQSSEAYEDAYYQVLDKLVMNMKQ